MSSAASAVSSWIGSHARRSPARVAVDDLAHGRSFTYAELDARVEALVGHLLGVGIDRGDRVALLARNTHHAIELQDACARLGAVFVPLNWRLTEAELRAAGEDCGPRFLLHESFLADKAAAVAAALGIATLSWNSDGRAGETDPYEAALAQAGARGEQTRHQLRSRPVVRSTDPWTIIYTSGTTGTPKGVVLTHGSAAATMLGVISAARVHTDAVSLTVLPFCHVAGLNLFTNPTLFMGGRVLILRELHTRLDGLAMQAYGWSTELPTPDLLGALAKLNSERGAEEQAGRIRWLRPEYQRPRYRRTAPAIQLDFGHKLDTKVVGPKRAGFPRTPIAQSVAVLQMLERAHRPLSVRDVSARFGAAGANRLEKVAAALLTLARYGHISVLEDGRCLARRTA